MENSMVLSPFRSPSLIRIGSQQPSCIDRMVLSLNESLQFLCFVFEFAFTFKNAVSTLPSPLKSPLIFCPTTNCFWEKQIVEINSVTLRSKEGVMSLLLYQVGFELPLTFVFLLFLVHNPIHSETNHFFSSTNTTLLKSAEAFITFLKVSYCSIG